MNRPARIVAAIIGMLLLLIIGFVTLNWAPDRPVAELETRWAPPPSTFIELAGMRVHLRDEGIHSATLSRSIA